MGSWTEQYEIVGGVATVAVFPAILVVGYFQDWTLPLVEFCSGYTAGFAAIFLVHSFLTAFRKHGLGVITGLIDSIKGDSWFGRFVYFTSLVIVVAIGCILVFGPVIGEPHKAVLWGILLGSVLCSEFSIPTIENQWKE